MRNHTSINENWLFQKPGCESERVDLPHTWNALDGQDGGNDYYRGTCRYTKELHIEKPTDGSHIWLEIPGAAMTADVFLNDHPLCHHEGGYSTFRTELTDLLTGNDILRIDVDNSENDRVYPQKADFTFYGGLYRGVELLTVPAAHFALGNHGAPGLKVTPTLSDDLHTAEVEVTAYTAHAEGRRVTVSVDGQEKSAEVHNGAAAVSFTLNPVRLWDGLDDPYLYTASAALDSGDEISVLFGCRSFRFDAEQGFFLNGRSYPLRGVSRHQDRKGLGNALSIREHWEDIAIIREMGANTIRLAHYQHAQEFYELCDETGMVVWAEIPYITQHMPNGRANTLSQMEELIEQNYNHPSIVCWGLSNEITASPADSADRLENHRLLNTLCHRLDKTRPTVMAHAFMLEIENEILTIPDLNSYNLYFGWYLGDLEQNDAFFDEYHAKYPGRVIGFSEYGADANVQFQSEKPEKGDYTESYQCLYHEHILKLIESRPWLWATHVWNMFDFAADGRDEGGKKGENQKGLVSFDRKLRKDAFYLYKAYWNREEHFIHLCGRRFVERCGETTEVKVYSNCPSVTLLVDGKVLETQEGEAIFRFTVPLCGEHQITARAGDCEDSMTLRRVAGPNPTYSLGRRGDVMNWFDSTTLDPDCYSIQDTMGNLMANAETAPLVRQLMDRVVASRGDVARAANGNVGLQRMMAGMKLESLLRQAGEAVTAEQIQVLNARFQKIRKTR